MKLLIFPAVVTLSLLTASAGLAANPDSGQPGNCTRNGRVTCVPLTVSFQDLTAGKTITLPAAAEPAMIDHFELRTLDRDHFVVWVYLLPQAFGMGLGH